jgi:polyisoprenoid-binding protein YceI
MKPSYFRNTLLAGMLLNVFIAITVDAQQANNTGAKKKLVVNTTESKINWTGKKPVGEHHGYVKLAEGEIMLSKNEIKGGSFVIDLNSITNTDLEDERMNKRLVDHLKSTDFFDVEKYPFARFVITGISKLNGSSSGNGYAKATHKVEGDLTMKGVTYKISFDASINVYSGRLTASSVPFTIDRTKWNVNYQSKSIFAELRDQFIYDDIILSVELVTK